ncbi:hypothetical protein D5086_008861 [Populus alba]|uniref:Uncharacterized protein n=1 Tax=Populus alba TaxID=43335 RepID=A0ACC4CGL8_POPAL
MVEVTSMVRSPLALLLGRKKCDECCDDLVWKCRFRHNGGVKLALLGETFCYVIESPSYVAPVDVKLVHDRIPPLDSAVLSKLNYLRRSNLGRRLCITVMQMNRKRSPAFYVQQKYDIDIIQPITRQVIALLN